MTPAGDRLPTGTVTFLFTDIEGSTKLLQQLGRDRYRVLEEEHARLMRDAVIREGGRVIRTEGDSFFVVFPTPTGAIRCAVAAQRSLAEHRFSHGEPLRIRIGMHTGEGHLGGGDYVGMDVNRAARIAAAGHGGQVVLSEATRSLVERELPEGVGLRDLGLHRLKDIAHPERIHDLVIEGLPTEFPPLKTLEVPSNLPAQPTSFVGRKTELRALAELVRSEGLVTLTGPGGTGKTRLAIRLADEIRAEFPGGVFFVDLSAVREPSEVPSAIARGLGVRDEPGRTLIEAVQASLADRAMLVLIDNFEQVVEAAPLLDELRSSAPGLRLLVTSRLRLGLAGEREFSVAPLDPPSPSLTDVEAVAASDAVALFVDRARAVRNDFALDGHAAAVAKICRRLDGLPLAIELAAVQVRLLSPQEIATRLGSHLASLGAGLRNLPERQRSLRGTIAWSHDLLGSAGRTLFARLSVFAGGASLEGIEEVCDPDRELHTDVLEPLATLVDHSLVRRVDTAEGSRFGMLETIREFALERLGEAGEAERIRELHASFYVQLAESAEAHLSGKGRDAWVGRLESDQANFLAAVRWAIGADRADLGLRVVGSVWRFWQILGQVAEARQLTAEVLELPSAGDPTRERARGLLALGSLAYWQADTEGARTSYGEGLGLARRLGDRDLVAEALFDLAYVEGVDGNFDVGHGLLEEAANIRDALGDRHGRAWVDVARATLFGFEGRWDEGVEILEQALAPMEEAGDAFGVENVLGSLAAVEFRRGNLDRAEELIRTTLINSSNWANRATGIASMASMALARGNPMKAVTLWGAFEATVEQGGASAPYAVLPLGDTRAEARAQLEEGQALAADQEGRSMDADEALRYGMGEEDR